jgi:rod shape-determining protein MreD
VTDVAKARIRMGLLLLFTVLVQTTLGADMRVAQVAPDLMVLLVILAGLTGGTEAGAWVGFWAGLLYDMFLTTTPVGLSALTYCLIGAAVGALRVSVLQERRALLPFAAFVGTAASVLLFVAAGDVLGQTQLLAAGRSWLIRVMIVESLWNAVLALPAGYIYAWAARGSAGADRVGAPFSARQFRSSLTAKP